MNGYIVVNARIVDQELDEWPSRYVDALAVRCAYVERTANHRTYREVPGRRQFRHAVGLSANSSAGRN